jgi:hypothetical protein
VCFLVASVPVFGERSGVCWLRLAPLAVNIICGPTHIYKLEHGGFHFETHSIFDSIFLQYSSSCNSLFQANPLNLLFCAGSPSPDVNGSHQPLRRSHTPVWLSCSLNLPTVINIDRLSLSSCR